MTPHTITTAALAVADAVAARDAYRTARTAYRLASEAAEAALIHAQVKMDAQAAAFVTLKHAGRTADTAAAIARSTAAATYADPMNGATR